MAVMAVMTAFPLSLVVILSSVSFSIDIDILDFFPNCSCTAFALSSRGTSDMPRTESSSAVSQDYLDFYYLFSAITFIGSGLEPQCKNGPGPQIIGPHNSPLKSCCPTSWSERKVLVMPRLYCGLLRSALHQCGCLFTYPGNIPDYEIFL